MAIILPGELSLTIEEHFVKKFKLFLTIICLDFFSNLLILFTTANDEPFLKASFKNKFPSFFFPFIAKKISFFFISLELIDAFRIFFFY